MSVLKLGSTGPSVSALQDRLRELGFDPGSTDGDFGPGTQAAVIAFQTAKGLQPDGIVGSLTVDALSETSPSSTGQAFAGFDTSIYPGDQKMNTWKQSSPYGFVAYYLVAPCHRNSSWMGRRSALLAMGWKLLPVYVGQQVAGVSPCSSSILTNAQGNADGADAAGKMTSEGFPPGAFVYLDIERTDTFSPALAAYIDAWVSIVAATPYRPAVYCHKFNADNVRGAVLSGLAGHAAIQPRFWVVGGVTSQFDVGTSKPTDVGVSFANLWQCPASVNRTFGAVTINIDENVSTWADPAA
ncbi:MAG TPA: glycoside hydrolase domain-containing protein [Bryobacteraceae bacterium]|nr:glycoside hydrolase domain-containing protein [Bryobacteraceae bacterium]